MPARRSGHHHGDLRNELELAALELVAERGAHGFTLAEASRARCIPRPKPSKRKKPHNPAAAMPYERANDGCGGWLYAVFCHATASRYMRSCISDTCEMLVLSVVL